MSTKPCEVCGKLCDPFELSLSEKGEICPKCYDENEDEDPGREALAFGKKALIIAAVLNAATYAVSYRTSSSSSFSVGKHGSKIVSMSADYADLTIAGLTTVVILIVFFKIFQARVFGENKAAFNKKKWIALGLTLLSLIWTGFIIWNALPYTATQTF